MLYGLGLTPLGAGEYAFLALVCYGLYRALLLIRFRDHTNPK